MAKPLQSIVRPLANRSAHVWITPRPKDLAESRELLRLISQYGEVEYYKNLKYDELSAPKTALIIFKEEQAAAAFLHRSPIRVRMGQTAIGTFETSSAPSKQNHDTHPKFDPFGRPVEPVTELDPFGRPIKPVTHVEASQVSPESSDAPPPQSEDMTSNSKSSSNAKIFSIQTNNTRINFRDHVTAGHYHGSFAVSTSNPVGYALRSSVPVVGLSCINWRREQKPWRIIQQEKDAEHIGPNRRKSLRELYDEGSDNHAVRNAGVKDQAPSSGQDTFPSG